MIGEKTLEKAVAGKRILIDSNIIIYLTDSILPFAKLSRRLFGMVERGTAEAVFSILSVAEVMRGPIKNGKMALSAEVHDYLVNFPNSHCQELTRGVLEGVGRNAAVQWEKLRVVDSLIIASGLYADASLFVSNDRHFKQSLPPQMVLSFE